MLRATHFLFLILFAYFLFECNCAYKRYDNYQVIRLSLAGENSTQKFSLANMISEHFLLDVWATNLVEGWMDVMIPPSIATQTNKIFSAFQYDVKIPDVQTCIDESENQQKQRRSDADFFENFQPYDVITEWLSEQEQNSNGKAEVFTVGNTYNGVEIKGLHLGKGTSSKPTLLIQCGIHAREWIAVTTCCWIIDKLLTDDLAMLDTFEFVIVPVFNVDGYIYTHDVDRLWRKNRRENVGSNCIGTDLNRNYGFGWGLPGGSNNPCSETYYGSEAWSGPETGHIRDLFFELLATGSLVSFFDIHSYSGLWMSPWGYTCDELPSSYPLMESVMRVSVNAVRSVNGRTYTYGPTCRTIYQTSGGSRDFTYGDGDVIHSYGVEAYGSNFTPPATWIPPIGNEIWAGVRRTALEAMLRK